MSVSHGSCGFEPIKDSQDNAKIYSVNYHANPRRLYVTERFRAKIVR